MSGSDRFRLGPDNKSLPITERLFYEFITYGSVERSEWLSLSEEQQQEVAKKVKEHHRNFPFRFNPETGTYQDDKAYAKWIDEEAERTSIVRERNKSSFDP